MAGAEYPCHINTSKAGLREVGFLYCVIPPRLERGTHSLEGCCSIQLSYGTVRYPWKLKGVQS